jgi:hypothetical protein
MKEEELAVYVVDYLESMDWDIYQEVQFRTGGKIADIVAVKDDKLWIVESKTTLSFKVLEQAHYWRCHYRSIAVPKIRNYRDRSLAYDICRNYLNLGVLEVSSYGITQRVIAPLMENFGDYPNYLMKQLKEGHKTHARAGSANGGHFTPYRNTMDHVKEFIKNNPGCTLTQILESVGKGHYSSIQSARGAIRNALENYEAWCFVKWDGRRYKYFVK